MDHKKKICPMSTSPRRRGNRLANLKESNGVNPKGHLNIYNVDLSKEKR